MTLIQEEVYGPPNPAAHRRGNLDARFAQVARRKAMAPPPGQATTIDEVLLRSGQVGKLANGRRRVLEAMVDLGGELIDPGGGAGNRLADIIRKTAPVTNVPNLLRHMHADRQLGREMPSAKRCTRLYLLDPIVPAAAPVTQHVPAVPEKAKKPKTAELPLPPLPSLRDSLRVFLVAELEDGTATLGVRDENHSWHLQVVAHSVRSNDGA